MPVPITMAEVMAEESRVAGLQEDRQEGQRELLCRQAARHFSAHTVRQLDALLKTTDDPAVFVEIAEAIMSGSTDKEFIDVCKGLISSH